MSNHRILSHYKLLRYLDGLNGSGLRVQEVFLWQTVGSGFLGMLSRGITDNYEHRFGYVFDADIFHGYNIDEL